jgi:predicted nucleic acid-binding protein
LFDTVHLAVPVYRELENGVAAGYAFLSPIADHLYPHRPDGWIRLTDIEGVEEQDLRARMPRRLHDGEAASIAIAVSRGWLLLTDDRDARAFAAQAGAAVSGTIGVLVLLVEQRVLTLGSANDIAPRDKNRRLSVAGSRCRSPDSW